MDSKSRLAYGPRTSDFDALNLPTWPDSSEAAYPLRRAAWLLDKPDAWLREAIEKGILDVRFENGETFVLNSSISRLLAHRKQVAAIACDAGGAAAFN